MKHCLILLLALAVLAIPSMAQQQTAGGSTGTFSGSQPNPNPPGNPGRTPEDSDASDRSSSQGGARGQYPHRETSPITEPDDEGNQQEIGHYECCTRFGSDPYANLSPWYASDLPQDGVCEENAQEEYDIAMDSCYIDFSVGSRPDLECWNDAERAYDDALLVCDGG